MSVLCRRRTCDVRRGRQCLTSIGIRLPLRRSELRLLLFLRAHARSGMALERAMRVPTGNRALSQSCGRSIRPAPRHPVERAGRHRATTARGESAISTGGDEQVRARYLIAAAGILSTGHSSDIERRDAFLGDAYFTGQWPHQKVDVRARLQGRLSRGTTQGAQLAARPARRPAGATRTGGGGARRQSASASTRRPGRQAPSDCWSAPSPI